VSLEPEVSVANGAGPFAGSPNSSPAAAGATAVTFDSTPVAPAGTTVLVPGVVEIDPMIRNFCDTCDEWTGQANTPVRGNF
jgi:hypothetical protein